MPDVSAYHDCRTRENPRKSRIEAGLSIYGHRGPSPKIPPNETYSRGLTVCRSFFVRRPPKCDRSRGLSRRPLAVCRSCEMIRPFRGAESNSFPATVRRPNVSWRQRNRGAERERVGTQTRSARPPIIRMTSLPRRGLASSIRLRISANTGICRPLTFRQFICTMPYRTMREY